MCLSELLFAVDCRFAPRPSRLTSKPTRTVSCPVLWLDVTRYHGDLRVVAGAGVKLESRVKGEPTGVKAEPRTVASETTATETSTRSHN